MIRSGRVCGILKCSRVLAKAVGKDKRREKTSAESTSLRVSANLEGLDQRLRGSVCEGEKEDGEADKDKCEVVNGRGRRVRGCDVVNFCCCCCCSCDLLWYRVVMFPRATPFWGTKLMIVESTRGGMIVATALNVSAESTVYTHHHVKAGQNGDFGYTDSSLGMTNFQVTVGSQKKRLRRSDAIEPCSQTGGGKVICR